MKMDPFNLILHPDGWFKEGKGKKKAGLDSWSMGGLRPGFPL